MSSITDPRYIKLTSRTHPHQHFFLVFMDLPADDSSFPDASQITPQVVGTELLYDVDFDLRNYNGAWKTCLLSPYKQKSGETINSVSFQSKGNKKGSTGPVITKEIWADPPGLTGNAAQTAGNDDYVLTQRVFVLRSKTYTDTYFVGGLVDFPVNVAPGPNLVAINNDYEVQIVASESPLETYLVYSPEQVNYYETSTPPTASILAMYVQGYSDPAHKGVLLSGSSINLYQSTEALTF